MDAVGSNALNIKDVFLGSTKDAMMGRSLLMEHRNGSLPFLLLLCYSKIVFYVPP